MRGERGFTLIEMVVAMGIFMIVMIMGTYAFQKVLALTGQQSRSAQSNIEGIAGLELLRYDVEHAGFGLPWRFQNYTGTIMFRNTGAANVETVAAANSTADGIDPTELSATQSTNIQPIAAGSAVKEVAGADVTNAAGGPDYLVIRSAMASLASAARKWSYINYSTNSTQNLSYLKVWNGAGNFSANDRIITLSSTFTPQGKQDKLLLMDGNEFEVALPSNLALPTGTAFKPADSSQIVVAHAIRNSAANGLRMPYNRTDYYVRRTAATPAFCNPGTGVLLKAVVSHDDGTFSPVDPVLDCVGDLQAEFEYDANDDGNITMLDAPSLSAHTAGEIRDHLKTVHIYILTHEGKKDRTFVYPKDSIQVGDLRRLTSGRILQATEMARLFGSDWRQYRWKVYTIVSRPKNLSQ